MNGRTAGIPDFISLDGWKALAKEKVSILCALPIQTRYAFNCV